MAAPADPLSRDELLAQRHFIAGLARRLVGEVAADDVAQETVARLLADANPRPHSLRAWLRTVVGNVARQLGRGDRRRTAREQSVARHLHLGHLGHATTPAAVDLAAQLELQRKLIERVLALAPIYREVVLLHFHGERTIPEIAAELAIPVETVRTRLRRALAELRAGWNGALGGEREGLAALVPLTQLAPVSVVSAGAVIAMSNGAKVGIAAAVVALAGAGWWWAGSTATPSRTS